MTRILFVCMGLMVSTLAPAQSTASKAKAAASSIPKARDGRPDLQGLWTNATITPMNRPAQFKDQPTVSDAVAKAYEKSTNQVLDSQDGQSDGPLRRGRVLRHGWL